MSIVPARTSTAAKRGFIRTTAQAYAATLTTGLSASVVLGVVTGEVQLIPTLVTVGVSLASPLLAGGASYLSILSSGIPDDYQPDDTTAPASQEPPALEDQDSGLIYGDDVDERSS